MRTIAISFLTLLLLLTTVANANPRKSMTAVGTAAEFLIPQNAVRASHGLAPLRWSSHLASYAQEYANKRRGDCALLHSDSNYGENLFWGKGRRWSISIIVAAWTIQQNYFDYRRNQCMPGKDCLHYTQIVWRTTKQVGCAKIVCNSGDTFVACEYDPHGNIIGQKPY